MKTGLRALFTAAAVGLLGAATSAQIIGIPLVSWKYRQDWTKPWHSFVSIVRDCEGSFLTGAGGAFPIAADDWICTASGPIVRVQWWGTSPQQAQIPNRQFLIRIFTDAQCRPASMVYSTCVLATNQFVNIDCRDRKVYRFSANLNPPFTQVAGTHYWLSIAEVDGTAGAIQSPTLNAVDFKWSAHRNTKNCPALQVLPGNVFIQPLLDACDNIEEDLSFILYRSAIIVHVPTPTFPDATLPRPVFVAEFRRNGDPNQVHAVECFTPDDDGSASLHPDLAPGMYQVVCRGGSFRPSFFDVFVDTDLGYFMDVGNAVGPPGDVDGDGTTDFTDLTIVLANWAP